MTKTQWSRAITVSGALLVALALVLGLTPNPAGSATSSISRARAEADALSVELGGTEILLGDPRIAQTPPIPPSVTGSTTGGTLELPLLGQLVAAGVGGQDAAVDLNGNSAACAGLVAPGGQITVASVEPPNCNTSPGPNGVVVNLTPLGLIRLRLDAIVARCSANAGGSPTATVEAINAAVETFNPLNIFQPWEPTITIPSNVQPNTSINLVDGLGGLIDLTLNEQPVPQTPGVAEAMALHLTVLSALIPGDGLLDVEVGRVECGVNSSSVATIDFDTSGSLGGGAVQPNTDNAIGMSFFTDVDRPNVTLEARLNDPAGVIVDPDRALPPGCTVSIDGVPDPDEQIVICQLGPVAANNTASAVIPVEITDAAADTVTAELSVYGTSVADELIPTFEETAAVFVEETFVAGNAGELAVPDPNRTGLPEDIPGTLYLDVPDYIEQASYGGNLCTLDPSFNPDPTVYPAIGGNITFNCGSAIPSTVPSPNALAFTYADTAAETAGVPDEGRVVIIREDGPGGASPQVPDNSYYADLGFFVDEAAPVTTTSTSTSTTSSTTPTSSSTSSTTPGSSSTSSTTPGSSSTSSTTPGSSSTSSTTPGSSSTSSTVGSGGGATTSTTARPLARTGTETRTTMSIALGLLGAGMVVTGRGMQAEVSILSRRRRS